MSWHRWPVRQRVLVNLHDGRAFDGILLKRTGPLLVLVEPRLIEPGTEPARLDGSVYIEHSNVSFIQVL